MLTPPANEGSTYIVTAAFLDEASDPVVPVAADWTLTDDAGTVINSRSHVALTPAASVDIVLSGDDLALLSSRTTRVIAIEATYNSTYGNGLPLRSSERFTITPALNSPLDVVWTYTLTNSVDGQPIADAQVWVTSDAGGTIVLASDVTDASGQVTFTLARGTVYVWRAKAGWSFTNPDTEVIT